jgi:hypothetical protein
MCHAQVVEGELTMSIEERPLADWPPSIANWLAFEKNEPLLAAHEFPLFTDAQIVGEQKIGPYLFINTVAISTGAVRPAIVVRYEMHKGWEFPDFHETNAELYHGGGPEEELAALASLAMGIRLRAGRLTRRFELHGDPLGTPTEVGDQVIPYFNLGRAPHLPSTAQGQHPLEALAIFGSLSKLSHTEARAIVRSARLYQEALWLAESEPALTWLLLVSALESAANEWQKEKGDSVQRLKFAKPALYEYLTKLEDSSILSTVADSIADSLGITRKFVDFVTEFLPNPPELRPPEWAQFTWEPAQLKKALKTIYGYRSKALHEGRPFPPPMSEAARLDPAWPAPAERMISMGISRGGSVWLQKDIPMNLHLFEYITRNVLLKWWSTRATKDRSV